MPCLLAFWPHCCCRFSPLWDPLVSLSGFHLSSATSGHGAPASLLHVVPWSFPVVDSVVLGLPSRLSSPWIIPNVSQLRLVSLFFPPSHPPGCRQL